MAPCCSALVPIPWMLSFPWRKHRSVPDPLLVSFLQRSTASCLRSRLQTDLPTTNLPETMWWTSACPPPPTDRNPTNSSVARTCDLLGHAPASHIACASLRNSCALLLWRLPSFGDSRFVFTVPRLLFPLIFRVLPIGLAFLYLWRIMLECVSFFKWGVVIIDIEWANGWGVVLSCL